MTGSLTSTSRSEPSGVISSRTETYPPVYAILPSRHGEVHDLVSSLRYQTTPPDMIQVVVGGRPNGKARNQGVSQVKNHTSSIQNQDEILVFVDDDALPGDSNLVQVLVQTLLDDDGIGVVGAARVLPPKSSWFQRRVAYEIPRTVNHIPDQPIETNPPLQGYGHSLITTTCCAVRLSVFEEAGGFSDSLTSGVDTDFFYRVRSRGYRFILAPDVHVHHPAPADLIALLRKFHWYGVGYGQEVLRRTERKMGPQIPTLFHQLLILLLATLWLVPNIFILYSFSYPKFEIGFRPLKALSSYAVAWGYVAGWRKVRA